MGTHVSSGGTVVVVRPSNATTSPIFQGGYVGSSSTIEKCLINADGSAYFASTVIGGAGTTFASGGFQVDGAGRLQIQRTDSNNSGYAIHVKKADNSDAVIMKGMVPPRLLET